ncbi:hypothetical protein D3C84_996080 [compost metagenome]
MLRRRQHGDDDLHIRAGNGAGRILGASAGLHQLRHCQLRQVEYVQPVAGLDQVEGHGAAHVAESDETDIHVVLALITLMPS